MSDTEELAYPVFTYDAKIIIGSKIYYLEIEHIANNRSLLTVARRLYGVHYTALKYIAMDSVRLMAWLCTIDFGMQHIKLHICKDDDKALNMEYAKLRVAELTIKRCWGNLINTDYLALYTIKKLNISAYQYFTGDLPLSIETITIDIINQVHILNIYDYLPVATGHISYNNYNIVKFQLYFDNKPYKCITRPKWARFHQ